MNNKIKFVKKALKTPYHFFFMTLSKQVTVVLEDKQGKRYTFTGNTMFNSVETAEDYVIHEIEAGSIKESITRAKTDKEKDEDENK